MILARNSCSLFFFQSYSNNQSQLDYDLRFLSALSRSFLYQLITLFLSLSFAAFIKLLFVLFSLRFIASSSKTVSKSSPSVFLPRKTMVFGLKSWSIISTSSTELTKYSRIRSNYLRNNTLISHRDCLYLFLIRFAHIGGQIVILIH